MLWSVCAVNVSLVNIYSLQIIKVPFDQLAGKSVCHKARHLLNPRFTTVVSMIPSECCCSPPDTAELSEERRACVLLNLVSLGTGKHTNSTLLRKLRGHSSVHFPESTSSPEIEWCPCRKPSRSPGYNKVFRSSPGAFPPGHRSHHSV